MSEPHPFHPKVTRYYDARGKRCDRGTPGARKQTEEVQTYSADLPRPGQRPERVSLGTRIESEAWERLAAILEQRRLEAEGLANPALAHARKALAEHVAEWLAVVKADGAGAQHLHQLGHDVARLARLAGWQRLADLDRDSISLALAKLTEAGASAQTRNHYLAHLRQFVRWAHDGGRMPQNPTREARRACVEADRRRVRREPTGEEVARLWAYLALPDCPVDGGLTGPARALAYKVALATGLRAGEVASLSDDSFDLVAGLVRVRAAFSKRRRLDRQQLPGWLLADLRAWRAEGKPLCWRFRRNRPGWALRRDLEACGVPYVLEGQEGPLYFDFHALRHWYCSQLANQPGIDIKTLTELCRHSTPALTIKTYAKLKEKQARAAVEALPEPGSQPGHSKKGAQPGAGGQLRIAEERPDEPQDDAA
jgi:integrase